MDRSFSPLTKVAIEAAQNAGDILRKGFGTQFQISMKPGILNYVTEYDHAAEACIIRTIKNSFPEHAFLAEESGASLNQEAEFLWIIDPLDGTSNFAHNVPVFSISIAAKSKEGVHCGVIYQPLSNELFVAERGKGSYLNGNKISVSSSEKFIGGFAATTFPRDTHKNPMNCVDHFLKILNQGTIIRNLGSSAINLAYVAAGRFDAYWSIALHPWDVAAAILLIEEAGGRVSCYDGNAYDVLSAKPLVASNSKVHQELLSNLT